MHAQGYKLDLEDDRSPNMRLVYGRPQPTRGGPHGTPGAGGAPPDSRCVGLVVVHGPRIAHNLTTLGLKFLRYGFSLLKPERAVPVLCGCLASCS